MIKEDVIIIGGGPCGMSTAIELQKVGLRPLIIEKGNIVNAIYHYPTHQTFFSSAEKLAIGDVPFISQNRKPKRNEALVYYREVAKRNELRLHTFEKVDKVEKTDTRFIIQTSKETYEAKYVIMATGYYDHPNRLNIPGEEKPKVFHYFKEGHPYYDEDVLVIGGKNSAIDAAIELEKAGARVTVSYRGSEYSKSIKPWVLPDFDALVRSGKIQMLFHSTVEEIRDQTVVLNVNGERSEIQNDFVFAMIGYHPNHELLKNIGIQIDSETGRPIVDEKTMETSIDNCYIAGVIAAGNNANEIFIENGRFHGELIAQDIAKKIRPHSN